MYCSTCNNTLESCICENLESRLNEAVKGGHFDYGICSKCSKHHARCKCEQPDVIQASLWLMLKGLNADAN